MPQKECWFGQECTAGVSAITAGIQLNILYLIKLVSRAVHHSVRAQGVPCIQMLQRNPLCRGSDVTERTKKTAYFGAKTTPFS